MDTSPPVRVAWGRLALGPTWGTSLRVCSAEARTEAGSPLGWRVGHGRVGAIHGEAAGGKRRGNPRRRTGNEAVLKKIEFKP